MLEIKSVSLKKISLSFFGEGTSQGGRESGSPKYWGGLLIKGGGLTDLEFFGGEGGGAR